MLAIVHGVYRDCQSSWQIQPLATLMNPNRDKRLSVSTSTCVYPVCSSSVFTWMIREAVATCQCSIEPLYHASGQWSWVAYATSVPNFNSVLLHCSSWRNVAAAHGETLTSHHREAMWVDYPKCLYSVLHLLAKPVESLLYGARSAVRYITLHAFCSNSRLLSNR